MGFGTLPKPGSELGPCVEPCEHKDCQQTRDQAASSCRFCNTNIGYDTPYTRDPLYVDAPDTWLRLVHMKCLEGLSYWIDEVGQVKTKEVAGKDALGPFGSLETAEEWAIENVREAELTVPTLEQVPELPAAIRNGAGNLSHYLALLMERSGMKVVSDNRVEFEDILLPGFQTLWNELLKERTYSRKQQEVLIGLRIEIESLKRRIEELTAGK